MSLCHNLTLIIWNWSETGVLNSGMEVLNLTYLRVRLPLNIFFNKMISFLSEPFTIGD